MAERGPWPAGHPGYSPLPGESTSTLSRRTRVRLGHPQSVMLFAVIAIGVLAAALLAGELYARHRAESVVAAAVECAVHDQSRVSFGSTRNLDIRPNELTPNSHTRVWWLCSDCGHEWQ